MEKKPTTQKKSKSAAATLGFVDDGPHAKHAERILNAVYTLNKAIEETHQDGVLVSVTPVMARKFVQLNCKVYRLTHHTMTLETKIQG